MANSVMNPFLKLFVVEEQQGLYPFCCDFMTKDDMRKVLEDLFPSKRSESSIKCDTDDDTIETDTENDSVTDDKDQI